MLPTVGPMDYLHPCHPTPPLVVSEGGDALEPRARVEAVGHLH